jgi:hypothetical protein
MMVGHGNLRCHDRPRHVPHSGHPYATEVSPGCHDDGKPCFGASTGGTCLRLWSLGLKLSPSDITTAPCYPACHIFYAFGAYVMYTYIFLHM